MLYVKLEHVRRTSKTKVFLKIQSTFEKQPFIPTHLQLCLLQVKYAFEKGGGRKTRCMCVP